jgi:hypothetical protein
LNELVKLSLPVVFSCEEAEHESLSTHDLGAADDDWRGSFLVIHSMDDALVEDVLIELMGLACHRALIHNEVIGPKCQSIDGYLQTRRDEENISDHYLILEDFPVLTITQHVEFVAAFGYLIQFLKLLLLLDVVDSGHDGADSHCSQDGHSLEPEGLSIFGVDGFGDDGDDGCADEDLQHQVF